jgi:drug/metabolite transporter (DMT)-like permease
MILLDIAAPFLLMWGLSLTTATNASLLANFEMVVTTVFALLFFKEAVGIRLWVSIGIITTASIVLCVDFHQGGTFAFSPGSLLILCACLCWGLENNCTRCLSNKNPAQIVIVKGFGSGSIALLLALATENMPVFRPAGISCALALGFVSYGLSIFLYVRAQRHLGAARTSMYYAAAPFFGALMSFFLLGERPGISFAVGAALMVAGTALAIYEKHSHAHLHLELTHEHRHSHADEHHVHEHATGVDAEAEHSHVHVHDALEHAHEHRPDEHHRHMHG